MQVLAGATEVVERSAERFYEPELFRLKGELTLALDPEQRLAAGAFFQHGLELARRQRTQSWELRLVTSLAALRRAQGRSEEGRLELSEVLGRFAEGLYTADLRKARAQLGGLTDTP
jgi:predicted ATPase